MAAPCTTYISKNYIFKRIYGLNKGTYSAISRNIARQLRCLSNSGCETKVQLSEGKVLGLSSGTLARIADGCAVADIGGTAVMATVVSKARPSSASFLPLTVDYRQKAAALGRIPTNFLRREMGPSEAEILTSRVIDRSLRPLFPTGFAAETQLVCSPLALDGVNLPDIAAINAASTALSLSEIPWNGPVGAVRVGLNTTTNELVVNPSKRELSQSCLNIIVVAAKDNMIVMLEGSADNVVQQDFIRAIRFGLKECQLIVSAIAKLQDQHGKRKLEVEGTLIPTEVTEAVRSLSEMRIREILKDFDHDKTSRDVALFAVRTDVLEKVGGEGAVVTEAFGKLCKETVRNLIFESGVRCDGRSVTQLRNISCKVALHDPLHGSALFQRGQTQVFCTVALDSPNSALKLDPTSILTSGLKEKNFFLHYEFPPFATNDIGRTGVAGRREVGHGALAERGLRPVVPADFPFTIRLTSEVLESNGSSSMASVCGGSLALMDAGVPLSCAAAGVAVGLVTRYNDKHELEDYRLLTDLLGLEDHFGDMDFKLAGTKKGITALQADIKIPGLPWKIVVEAIQMATTAKSEILNIMADAIREPRKEKKDNWPVMEKLAVPPHKRSKVIGLGGGNLKRLELEIGVSIMESDGEWWVFAPNAAAMAEAKEAVASLLQAGAEPQLEFGGIYKAKVVELRDIGCMVTLYDTMTPTLIHNTQLDQKKVLHPSALGLEVGQEIQVKYFGRDPVSGTMRLSRKVLQTTAHQATRNLSESKPSSTNS